MLELIDNPVLETGIERCAGLSPAIPTLCAHVPRLAKDTCNVFGRFRLSSHTQNRLEILDKKYIHSSIGRVSDSKSEGCEFEACWVCNKNNS